LLGSALMTKVVGMNVVAAQSVDSYMLLSGGLNLNQAYGLYLVM